MKRFKHLIYALAAICICLCAYSLGHEDGKQQGYKNGISYALDSIIEVEILTPESIDNYVNYKINEHRGENN